MVILYLKDFIEKEREYWKELEEYLKRLEREPEYKLDIEEIKRFHYLYQRTVSDLAKISNNSFTPQVQSYLEGLVSRAYAEIYTRERSIKLVNPIYWLLSIFPQTFRRHIRAFWISFLATLIGVIFGGIIIMVDSKAKAIIMPFSHLRKSPEERIKNEQISNGKHLDGKKVRFAAYLMTHNIRVSILVFALGITYGIGTLIMLFYNGVILGAVSLDYISSGYWKFLFGWLLPHGAIEIPAIIIAGQAGLVLTSALIGWGDRNPIKIRLQNIITDVVNLLAGVALMLIWAGIVESFFSQYHEPILPYWLKILFGVTELTLLLIYLSIMDGQETSIPSMNNTITQN